MQSRILAVFLGLGVAGCSGKDDKAADDTADTSDTGDTADSTDTADTTDTSDTSDTTDTSDTSDTSDTGDTGGTGNMSFSLAGEVTGTSLSLTYLNPSSVASGRLETGTQLLSVTVTTENPFYVVAGAPSDDLLVEIDPTGAPGMKVAYYLAALFIDTDANGAINGDETVVGLSHTWLVYATGTIGADYATQGLITGWNAGTFDADPATYVGPFGVQLAADLTTVDTLEIGGTFAASTSDTRLALVPNVVAGGGTVADLLYDEATSDTWTVTVDGIPADDHFEAEAGYSNAVALETPLVYTDDDADGGYTLGDTITAYACTDDGYLQVGYLPPPHSVASAMVLSQSGLKPGWFGKSLDGASGHPVGASVMADVTLDDTCGP